MSPLQNSLRNLTKKLSVMGICHLPILCGVLFLTSDTIRIQLESHWFAISTGLQMAGLMPALLVLTHELKRNEKLLPRKHLWLAKSSLAFSFLLNAWNLSTFSKSISVSVFFISQLIQVNFIANFSLRNLFLKRQNYIENLSSILGDISFLISSLMIFALILLPSFNATFSSLFGIAITSTILISASSAVQFFKHPDLLKNARLFFINSYYVAQLLFIYLYISEPIMNILAALTYAGTVFFMALNLIIINEKNSISESNEKNQSDVNFLSAATLDNLSAQVCILDGNGKIVSCNKSWSELFFDKNLGSSVGAIDSNFTISCESDSSINRESLCKISQGLKFVMNSNSKEFVSQVALTVRGIQQWFYYRVGYFDSDIGRHFLIILEDISELKKKEEELLLKSFAIERANDGIVLTDPTLPDNPIVYVSQGFLKLTGYSEEEVIGKNCRFMQGPDSDPRVIQKIRDAIGSESPFDGEIINYTKDGRPWYNRLKLEPIRNNEGKLIRYVGVQLNVTEEKKLDFERRRALQKEKAARQDAERLYNEAQNANSLKDEFLATLSHELRTPAGVIVGFTELLKYEELATQEKDEALEAIERNARALVTLIDDMLDMSRAITGKFKLNPKPVDLTSVVESVIAAEVLAAQTKNIRIVTEFEPGAGPIFGDTTRLQQIFWNLLSNAIKFTPRNGRVKVSIHTEGNRLIVRVADTGVGIESRFLPHVFERFRQQESGMNRNYGGLGLGLSIVKHLVELHGGSVQADSAGIGRGSTFTVNLPAITSAG